MLVAGIDIGSITTESLLFDSDKGILGYEILQTGADSKKTAEAAFEKVLAGPAIAASDSILYCCHRLWQETSCLRATGCYRNYLYSEGSPLSVPRGTDDYRYRWTGYESHQA